MIELCADSLVTMAFDRTMGKVLSYQEKIHYMQASNALYQTMLQTEENVSYFHCKFAWNYRRLAELWCAQGNRQKALLQQKIHSNEKKTQLNVDFLKKVYIILDRKRCKNYVNTI